MQPPLPTNDVSAAWYSPAARPGDVLAGLRWTVDAETGVGAAGPRVLGRLDEQGLGAIVRVEHAVDAHGTSGARQAAERIAVALAEQEDARRHPWAMVLRGLLDWAAQQLAARDLDTARSLYRQARELYGTLLDQFAPGGWAQAREHPRLCWAWTYADEADSYLAQRRLISAISRLRDGVFYLAEAE
ncbi:hypothetical protein JNUCC0626_49990 (plasmid) [Lentzea sp. JNUCC 0626]|uniref:hypothetical protein n=1 Tax=Lentzea sp. JNUCC 0626 TaxID=3367513 RepID=UPI0037485E0F